MKNNISVFNFNNTEIQVINKDGEAYFVASEIAEILGYREAFNLTRVLDDDEAAPHNMRIRSENGVEQDRSVTIISESGLYHAIFKSRKKEAMNFRKWVTSEVLPSLRKTGEYKTPAKRGRPRLTQKPEFPEHLRITRPIRNRDDLSFTKRDENGDLLNWYVPYDRENSWHENYGIGAIWFEEIVELAKHNPEEAYYAIKFSAPYVAHYVKLKESPHNGQASGFYHRMAVWTIAGVLANQGQEPQLPFQPVYMGKPPLEGFGYFLQKAAPRRELTPQEQYAIDQRARELANECHKLCYERRRYELMLQAV
ncbi:BRO-N domain-containing protein [Stenoxybacter acetivorans]|uniref:BRO-N domain-containing protein n=1 Tax=Stenoxybacter acetivorans TaxID=422441 RepID=UPI000691BBF1|nr:BRO family protein [Stenoxybacter acetivorans]